MLPGLGETMLQTNPQLWFGYFYARLWLVVQWVTKVLTPASMYSLWQQGS